MALNEDEQQISDDEIRQMALALLARREHGRRELSQKLRRKLGRLVSIDDVLEALEAEGYLSDRRYAASMTRSRTGKGYGPLRVKAELSAKGVSGDLAEQALHEEPADWVQLARQALVKRFGQGPAVDQNERAKRYRYLAQRGFNAEQIRAAMNEKLGDGFE